MYKMGLSIKPIYKSIKNNYQISLVNQIGRYSFLLPMLLKQVDNSVDLSIIVTIYQKRG